jgi:hypothetical protein
VLLTAFGGVGSSCSVVSSHEIFSRFFFPSNELNGRLHVPFLVDEHTGALSVPQGTSNVRGFMEWELASGKFVVDAFEAKVVPSCQTNVVVAGTCCVWATPSRASLVRDPHSSKLTGIKRKRQAMVESQFVSFSVPLPWKILP